MNFEDNEMTLPLKTLNRLRLGRDVAARVEPEHPNFLAWVYVHPILNERNGQLLRGHGAEPRIVSANGGNAIAGFLVRHLAVPKKVAEEFYSGKRASIGVPPVDERIVVMSEEELTTKLETWTGIENEFHVPDDVGYLFEFGPDLLD